jgi:hypothetical protein
MLKKSAQTIVIALCTSAALIGFAFFQRYGGGIRVSETTMYAAAAIICVSPVIYRLLRCQSLPAE